MILYYLVAIANGFLNTINKMVNVKAGQCLGTANGALINYIEATLIAFCLAFVMGDGGEFRFSHIIEVPILFYLGSICGLAAMIFLMVGTSKKGAMASMVLMLLGQLCTSIVLDYVFFGTFRATQILGIFFILVGIGWKEKMRDADIKAKALLDKEGEL